MIGADYTQICTLIGSLLGMVSFILYFPLKKRESNAKTESQSVDTLRKVVDSLREEIKRGERQKQGYESRIEKLELRVEYLETGKNDNDTAFAASSLCSFFIKNGVCTIINKKKELEKRKKWIKKL